MNTEATTKSAGSPMSLKATLVICAGLAILAAVALLAIYGSEPEVRRESTVRETTVPVEVFPVTRGDYRPELAANGLVRASREVTVRPRVAGEIIERAPELVPGGFPRQGEMLLRVDDTDYRIALQQRESELQQAVSELEIENGRRDIAERDYLQLGKELEQGNRALVLREPQRLAAEARVQSARAAVEQAMVDLGRTVIRAPFDAQVLSREVEIGSQVSPGDSLARLVGVDRYWVEISLPLDRLRWVQLPSGDLEGSAVAVRHRTAWPAGGERFGRLDQLIGELEGETRMARLLAVVEDPLGQGAGAEGQPGLIIGSFVQCRISGVLMNDVVRLNRDYVRQDESVWVMAEGKLTIRKVDIVFQDAEHAYIAAGLEHGDQVITSSLATVREGLAVRVAGDRAMPGQQP